MGSPLQGSWKIDLEEATCRSHVIGQVAFTPGCECCGTIYIISPGHLLPSLHFIHNNYSLQHPHVWLLVLPRRGTILMEKTNKYIEWYDNKTNVKGDVLVLKNRF